MTRKRKFSELERIEQACDQHTTQLLVLYQRDPSKVRKHVEDLFIKVMKLESKSDISSVQKTVEDFYLKTIMLQHLEVTQKGEHGAPIDLQEALNFKI